MAKGKKHYKSSGSLNFKLMSMEINKDISYVCEQLTEDLVDSAVSSFDDFLDILKFSAENNSFYFCSNIVIFYLPTTNKGQKKSKETR